MDFYQGVVLEYLRADRAIFINTECCIQLSPASNPDTSGPHWYCDAVACDFRSQTVFLCEVSYSKSLAVLIKRLSQWHKHWPGVCAAVQRDCHVPKEWRVRPWLFVPKESLGRLVPKLEELGTVQGERPFRPRITPLEMVQPWRYRSWDHRDQDHAEEKPPGIPLEMRI